MHWHAAAGCAEAEQWEAGVEGIEGLRARFNDALVGEGGAISAADRLCAACVDVLDVDGASVSMVHRGSMQGTFGASGDLSRRLDELQFTFGEGPCLDAVRDGQAVSASDLDDPAEQRWPAFSGALREEGVRAVFAFPVMLASTRIGALDLFRREAGHLTAEALGAGMLAAELASVPLLGLITNDVDWAVVAEGGDGWDQLASLERVEVYQATGMIMGALDVDEVEALVRLRAHAFATGRTASAVAWSIVEREMPLAGPDWQRDLGGPPRRTS